jgi:DNA-binding sugar fermentation-stimulating protein
MDSTLTLDLFSKINQLDTETYQTSNEIVLYDVSKFTKALVINRPSKKIKSPYLADIKLFDDENNLIDIEHLAHSPTLGCNGMISPNVIVYVTENNNSETRKSKYTIFNIQISNPEIIIGVHPMTANAIFENILKNNILDEFKNAKNIKREITILNSRIDFYCEINNKKVYLEVKNVPIADYINSPLEDKKDKKIITTKLVEYNEYEKIGLFPLGYRKKKEDLISPRAYKHLEDLIEIQKKENHQSYLIYIIQRSDVKYFSPSLIDKTYYDKVYEAIDSGVKVIPLLVTWKDEKVYFNKIAEFLDKVN